MSTLLKDLGEIDPGSMDAIEQKALLELLKQQDTVVTFPTNKLFQVYSKKERTFYSFKLSKAIKNLGYINPTLLNNKKYKDERRAVYEYLKKYRTNMVFHPDKLLAVYSAKKKIYYRFMLTNKIVRMNIGNTFAEDKYSVFGTKKIGVGGFGSVRKLLGDLTPVECQLSFTRRADRAVKKLKQRDTDHDIYFRYLEREVNLAMETPHLDFSSLVFFQDPRHGFRYTTYIDMRYFHGKTIDQLEFGAIPSIQLQKYFLKMAYALRDQYHDRKLIHRDIKPNNIIIDESNHVYIIDVGLGKKKGEKCHEAVGCQNYAAPEQIKNHFTKEKADIYSLGLTCKEILDRTSINNKYRYQLEMLFYKMQSESAWRRPSIKKIIEKLEGIFLLMKLEHADVADHEAIRQSHENRLDHKKALHQKALNERKKEVKEKKKAKVEKFRVGIT